MAPSHPINIAADAAGVLPFRRKRASPQGFRPASPMKDDEKSYILRKWLSPFSGNSGHSRVASLSGSPARNLQFSVRQFSISPPAKFRTPNSTAQESSPSLPAEPTATATISAAPPTALPCRSAPHPPATTRPRRSLRTALPRPRCVALAWCAAAADTHEHVFRRRSCPTTKVPFPRNLRPFRRRRHTLNRLHRRGPAR